MKKIISVILAVTAITTMLVWYGNREQSISSDSKTVAEKKDSENKEQATDSAKAKKEDKVDADKANGEKKDENSKEKDKESVAKADDKNKGNSNSVSADKKSASESEKNNTNSNVNKDNNSNSNSNSNTSNENKPQQPEQAKPEPVANYVTISITCNTILNNMDKVVDGKKDIIPSNGVILGERQVEIKDGDNVFDVLKKQTRSNGIHMDFMESPVYQSVYIKGLANIYEFDVGNLSGWMYSVNGVFPNYGASKYIVKPGDKIEWKYTCDLGKDLGNEF